MKKRIFGVIGGIGIAVAAIFIFLFFKLQSLENQLAQRLESRHIQVESVKTQLFPQPTLSLKNVKYEQWQASKINAQLAWRALFQGEVALENLQIEQARLGDNADNNAQITMHFEDLPLSQLFAENVIKIGKSRIEIQLARPLYGNNKKFSAQWQQGEFQRLAPSQYQLAFEQLKVNEVLLGELNATTDFANMQKHAVAKIRPADCDKCGAQLSFTLLDTLSAVYFSGESFPVENLLALFRFPETIQGKTDFNIQLNFADSTLTGGEFYWETRNGELIGLNLLELAAQYFPVNINDELTEGKKFNTKFEQFITHSLLQGNQLTVDKISLKTTALLGEGKGIVDLNKMQCDANLTLRAADSRYQAVALPIRFFGDCRSPQYKINFNREFRHQLMDMIKEKLR